jgi:EF-P lysine aminoacylase GenX
MNKLYILQIREKVVDAIRSFLKSAGFLEVTTPNLVPALPAESYYDVFETKLLDRQRNPSMRYLTTSPEVALKKLLVRGIGNCFEITKSFRNTETQSSTHNPEFTILEWYRVNADYMDVMKDCENLIMEINKKVNPYAPFQISSADLADQIDITPPWPRISIKDACQKFAHYNLDAAFDFDAMKKIFVKKGYKFEKNTTWEQMFDQIFMNEVDREIKKMNRPVILYDFPTAMGALAKKKKNNPNYVERFEFYMAGLELGDAYSELQDAKEQEDRFKNEVKKITRLGKNKYEIDWDFIKALKSPGLPRCSGIAVGIDRLVMLFADCDNIQEVL